MRRSSRPATSAASRCGRWEVRATAWSCSSGPNITGVAPHSRPAPRPAPRPRGRPRRAGRPPTAGRRTARRRRRTVPSARCRPSGGSRRSARAGLVARPAGASGAALTLPTSVTRRRSWSAPRRPPRPRWSGGTATTTSCGRTSSGSTFAAPSPVAIRRFSTLTSRSATSMSWRRSASADRRTEEAGADDQDRARAGRSASASLVGDLAHAGQVAAQRGGAVQVDVGDVGARQVGLHVRDHPHHPRHRALDLQLPGADQRHLAEAEPAGGVGRELRDQVAGRGEDDADEVVDRQAVGLHDVEDHLRDPLEHVLADVVLELRRAAHRPALPREPTLMTARKSELRGVQQHAELVERELAHRPRSGRSAARGR